VEQPSPEYSGGKGNASVNWVVVVAAIIVILWVIYSHLVGDLFFHPAKCGRGVKFPNVVRSDSRAI